MALEELCIDEGSTMLLEKTDVVPAHDGNLGSIAAQAENSTLKNTAVVEEIDTQVASVAPDIEARTEKAIFPDNDAETKETRQKEAQKSQEFAEERASFSRAKENFFKHKAVQDTQDEVIAKRMRLQREDDEGGTGKIAAPQSPEVVENEDIRSLSPIPKIRKIETVHYDITPIASVSKPARHPNTVASSVLSPSRYEYCDSNMSIFNQDFTSKGHNSQTDKAFSRVGKRIDTFISRYSDMYTYIYISDFLSCNYYYII